MKWLNDYRMRLVLFGVVAAMVLNGGSAKADFIWTQKADMPTPRWNFTTCEVDGKIYAIGGSSSENTVSPTPSAVEEYDTATDTWMKKADIPIWMGANHASVVNGKIYTVGGGSGSMVYMYDPVTDTWIRKADMPTSRGFVATSTVNGKIYAIGGTTPGEYSALSTVEEYDPATDTWTRKADMPAGRWALCTSVVNNKIYAIGGRPDLQARPDVQEYDPSTDTWRRKSNMPIATSQMDSVVLDNKIFVIGGWLWSLNYPYTTVQVYDPETDIWTREADTPFLRAGFSAEVVNNKIYVIGGTDRPHPCPAFPTVFEFGTLFDFNWDGIVDDEDVSVMIDNWNTDNPLCDIAPLPLGDGFVDVQDLAILAEHLFEEVFRMELVAYWKLDEEEGDIAYNSIDDNHGILTGNPTWQPGSGQIVGAMEFDGIDDYISTDFVLDPSWGAFSVFAWIKGGAPGQVIISQLDGIGTGEAWLGMDESIGNLVTGLVPAPLGRSKPTPLESEFVITDGQWHHVGFVWDGSYRSLYADGIEVEKDTNTFVTLNLSTGGLYIGAGKTLDAETFFSGLIDDVRIYNQALTPEEIAALAK